MMYKLPKSKLGELFTLIKSREELYLPIEKAGRTLFSEWTEEEDKNVRLDLLNSDKSAKDLFFPQSENLVAFKTEDNGKKISVVEHRDNIDKFVIFGVRACDARSLDVLDRVFLADPVDSYYKSRRENGTIVTLACARPEQTCFCTAFGIDPANPAGDVSAWFCGEDLCLSANTEKGSELVSIMKPLLEETDGAEVERAKSEISSVLVKLPYGNLSLDGWGEDELLEKFSSPKWDELSSACLGCGSCTFSCPTCQCYDIRDFDCGSGVIRYRCWDSCMYSDFTKMSAGQPRPTQKERFRQRFMHKLVYFPTNNDGMFSCVGCGRCLRKCPVSLNIVKVVKSFAESKA